MSDQEQTEQVEIDPLKEEIAAIKSRLDLMGIKYHHRAGVEKLRGILHDTLNPPAKKEVVDTPAPVGTAKPTPISAAATPTEPMYPPGAYAVHMNEEQHEKVELGLLKRVLITCKNPNKREWPGELIDAGNRDRVQRKYVKFDTPYHVPVLVYNYLQEKEFQMFKTRTDPRGNEIKEGFLVNEYTVVDLPPLSIAERKKIGMTQIMRKGQEAA